MTTEERSALAERYGYIVHMTLPRLLPSLPATLEAGDVLSEGMLAILEGIEAFDPARDVKLETYLIHRVRWRMLECVRKHSGVPSKKRKIQKALACAQAASRNEGNDSDAAVAVRMGLDTNAYLDLVRKAQNPQQRNERFYVYDRGAASSRETEAATIADENAPDPEEEALAGERRDLLKRALGSLTDVERRLVTKNVEDGEYLRHVAAELGLTTSQARGRRRSALAKMAQALEPYRECFGA